jgi:hypothetical protein
VVETERHLFSREMNRRTVACCAYKAGAAEHVSSHRFSLLPSHLSCYFQSFPATCCITPILRPMAEGPSRDPTVASSPVDEDTESDSGPESIAATAFSPTRGTALMAKGEIPELSDFFKKTSVTNDERQAYHEHDWLIDNVISSIPEVDVPTIEGSTIVYFEPHLVVGL